MWASIRSAIKQLSPPLLVGLYVALKKRFTSHEPEWHTVARGPLAGHELLVNARTPAFAAMVAGTYDDFFWRYLAGDDLVGSTICDVGGHVGYHSLAFAALAGPEGRVLTFEPNPANLERIRLNMDRNAELSASIEVRRHALADFAGFTMLNTTDRVDDETSSGGFIKGSSPPLPDRAYEYAGFATIEVEVRPLDEVLAGDSSSKVKLIKVDVEGAELAVLRGAEKTIERHRPVLLVEAHTASSIANVVQMLCRAGYGIEVLEDTGSGRAFLGARSIV